MCSALKKRRQAPPPPAHRREQNLWRVSLTSGLRDAGACYAADGGHAAGACHAADGCHAAEGCHAAGACHVVGASSLMFRAAESPLHFTPGTDLLRRGRGLQASARGRESAHQKAAPAANTYVTCM